METVVFLFAQEGLLAGLKKCIKTKTPYKSYHAVKKYSLKNLLKKMNNIQAVA
jgi:hypothetical protein